MGKGDARIARPPLDARWRTVALACLLLALLLVAYWPALRGEFLWDDDAHISDNASLRSLSGLRDIWLKPGATIQYYPLTFTFFWAGYQLWGPSPLGFHLLNLGMHALVALLLWRLLARLRVPGAFAGALLFAVHPVNVMSVAWMTELKNTLSSALALAACLAYLRFAGVGTPDAEANAAPGARGGTGSRSLYAASLALFVLAMFAKTALAFVPVTLALILWWKKDRVARRELLGLGPFVLIVAAMGAITIIVERWHGGDVGRSYSMGLAERMIVSGRSFWFYLAKFVFPHPLVFIYPRWTIDAGNPIQYLPALATIAVMVALFLARGRFGKGPFVAVTHFWIATSALIFLVVTYFTRFSYVSDHWQYFGMMGMTALAGAGTGRIRSLRARRGIVAAVVGVLTILTWRQCPMYANAETLYRATLARNPECWLACNNLGALLTGTDRNQEAMDLLTHAVRIEPQNPESHYNLGNALKAVGRNDAAIDEYNQALRLGPDLAQASLNLGIALAAAGRTEEAVAAYERTLRIKPDGADAHYNLGIVMADTGKPEAAIEQYGLALRIRPDFADARTNLGLVLARQGRIPEAIEEFNRALAIDPRHVKARNNLAAALAGSGRTEEAIEQYRNSIRISPDDAQAHLDLGNVLYGAGRIDEAVAQFNEAVRLTPNNSGTLINVGLALARANRLPEAVERYQQALRLDQGSAEAHNNLGVALARMNRIPEALEHFQQALRLKPDYEGARANLRRVQESLGRQP